MLFIINKNFLACFDRFVAPNTEITLKAETNNIRIQPPKFSAISHGGDLIHTAGTVTVQQGGHTQR